jgi:hypothetical protein
MTSAELCRANGWKPGDVLKLTFPTSAQPLGTVNGAYTVRLTAIGERAVLARRKGSAEFMFDLTLAEKVEKVARHL